MTVDDIRQLLDTDERNLARKILHFGHNLRGTAQYWFTQPTNLIEMTKQLGNATAFFTFSVADLQWPDLAKFLKNDCTISDAVAHAPLTVSSYVMTRFELFFKYFLKPYLSIEDYRYRVEWQHRGSLHIHGLAWPENAPNCKRCTEQEIVTFWDKFVSAMNPAMQPNDNPDNFYWPVDPHPSSIHHRDVHDLDQHLKNLVNVCQRHTRCSAGYCLRTQRNGQQKCRFGFPKPLQQHTTVSFAVDDNGHGNHASHK